jgi:hypothetical protein
VIDWRVVAGQVSRYDELAAELVRAETDMIVAANPNP